MPRIAKPWYRTSQGSWYATVDGRKVALGVRGRENEAAAWAAWSRLRGDTQPTAPPVAVPKPATPPPATPVPAAHGRCVVDVVNAFLEDAAARVAAGTLELYRCFLRPFAAKYGKQPAAAVTCPTAEAYSRQATWNDSTRAAFLSVLSRAFRHAERSRLIDRTPLTGLRKPLGVPPVGSGEADGR